MDRACASEAQGQRFESSRARHSSDALMAPNPMKQLTILLLLSALSMGACESGSRTAPKRTELGWRPVASWSGRGNTQTESFNIESGQWRIRWETSPQQLPAGGTFRVSVQSLVSGRFVDVAVEHQGAGSGIAYVAEDPRPFFLVIESSDVDWKVAVEEGVVGEEEGPR
jgi:hypothetical protein